MTHLIITRGHDHGARFPLKDFPITVGRDPGNTVSLQDEEISRFHIRIKQKGRLFILEDLGSKNGCFVNGDRALNTILQNGDKILLGNTELLFACPNQVNFSKNMHSISTTYDEKLGISGPFLLDQTLVGENIQPFRINLSNLINKQVDNPHSLKKIYDLQGDILVISTLEESANAMLKALSHLAPSVTRIVQFLVNSTNQELIPIATRHNEKIALQFSLNHKALSEVMSRKQGILLQYNRSSFSDDAEPSPIQKRHRLVLPMIYHDKLISLFHIECDDYSSTFAKEQIELLQIFISRTSFFFENMLLRMEIDSLMLGMVETMVKAIEAKDTYTVGHSERVSKYSMGIADELKLNKETRRMLLVSSLCHDIGKIGIPDSILKKASSLTNEEYEEMKLHPTIGANIIANLPNAKKFLSGIKYHHEKWDGTGYPEGLMGEDIPFFGRIVAVADVFDALVSGRSYSGFIDEADAIEKIQKEIELFDPEIVKALVKAWEGGLITSRTSTFNKNKP